MDDLYQPIISLSSSDTLDSSGMAGGLPPHMSMGGNSGPGGHPPPDIKPDISSLTSPTSTHGGGYFHGYPPPGMGGAGNGMPSSTGGPPTSGPPPQMHSPGMHSPTSSLGSPLCLSPTGPSPSPGLPHSSLHTKHICAICGDRASGKHYGVYRSVDIPYKIRCMCHIMIIILLNPHTFYPIHTQLCPSTHMLLNLHTFPPMLYAVVAANRQVCPYSGILL